MYRTRPATVAVGCHRPDMSHVSLTVLVVALALGCDSSPNGVTGGHSDGAPLSDGSARADGGKKCTPFGTSECARGETCCLNGFNGTCRALDACGTTTQFQCGFATDCESGEACCGTFMDSPDGVPTATTFCGKSCASPSHSVCTTSQDCTTGTVCTVLPEGSNSPVLAAAVEVFSVCLPPDGGTGP